MESSLSHTKFCVQMIDFIMLERDVSMKQAPFYTNMKTINHINNASGDNVRIPLHVLTLLLRWKLLVKNSSFKDGIFSIKVTMLCVSL